MHLRRTLAALAFALLLPLPLAAAAADPQGLWLADAKIGVVPIRFVLELKNADDGTLGGTFSSPDGGPRGLPLSDIEARDGALRFTVQGPGARFEGRLNATTGDGSARDGDEIAGRLTHEGRDQPLVFRRIDRFPEADRPQEPRPPLPYSVEEVTFRNPSAGINLSGTLTLPPGPGPHPAVLLIAGSGPATRDSEAGRHRPFLVLADYLTRRGIAVLRYDKRGCGASEGNKDVWQNTLVDFADDAAAGLAYLKGRKQVDGARVGMLGASEGGSVAPLAAAKERSAFIVMLAGAALSVEDIVVAQAERAGPVHGESPEQVRRAVEGHRRVFRILREEKDVAAARARLLAELAEADPATPAEKVEQEWGTFLTPYFHHAVRHDHKAALAAVRCPVLALTGEKDLVVSSRPAMESLKAALAAGRNPDATVLEIPGVNHMFQTAVTGSPLEFYRTEETTSPRVLQLVADWISARTGAPRAAGR